VSYPQFIHTTVRWVAVLEECCYNRRMIINNYFISPDLELSSCRDHDDETKIVFIIFNHFTCTEQVISEDLAKFLCNTEDATINTTNWNDFVHATGEFTEIN